MANGSRLLVTSRRETLTRLVPMPRERAARSGMILRLTSVDIPLRLALLKITYPIIAAHSSIDNRFGHVDRLCEFVGDM